MNLSPLAPEDIALDPHSLLRIGLILSVDLEAGRAIVQIGDTDAGAIETPPLKWAAARHGKTRIWSPPAPGEQVLVAFPGGEISAGIIVASISYMNFPNVANMQADIIEFEDGTTISYIAEQGQLSIHMADAGNIDITAPSGITLSAANGINIIGPVEITGTLTVSDNVDVTGILTASDDVVGGGKSLKSHKHLGVMAGGAQSGIPA